jgi:hypothetical protein
MTDPDKIIPQVGERPRQRAFQLPHLRPFLWDARIATCLHRACRDGSITILARTWRWVRAAAPGDRWIRALVPGGVLAGVVYALRTEPRAAAAGIVVAWLVAAAILAPREVWTPPGKGTQEAPQAAAQPSTADLIERDRRALLQLLDEATAQRNGVHLAELYELTSAHPLFAAVPRANLGALLAAFGVPVTRALSVDGISGRTGVRRADVVAFALPPSPAPAQADSLHTESAPDQHESQALSDGSRRPLGAALGPP